MSVSSVPDKPSLLIMTTDNGLGGELIMYEIRSTLEGKDTQERLTLVYKCANITEQLPILPNQIRQEHQGLLQRAVTDLSVDIAN